MEAITIECPAGQEYSSKLKFKKKRECVLCIISYIIVMQKGEKKVSENLKYFRDSNHSVTNRTRMRWAMCFLSAFYWVSLTFLKAHGLTSLTMHPSGITYGKQNTQHLKWVCQAVNFSAKEPAITTVFACFAAVRVTASMRSTAS